MTVEIEKNVPMPSIGKKGPQYPVDRMEVGDSILDTFPSLGSASITLSKQAWIKGLGSYRFRSRYEGEKVRVWRIA